MASPSYDHPRPKRRRFRRVSRSAWVGAALAGLAFTAVSPPASEAVALDGSVAAPAGSAVVSLTSGDPGAAAAAAIPRDFGTRMGYEPVVRQGLLVAPDGNCSSPVELPREFETACMAHDLGYDLLRYAERTGTPLGPWARQALDRALGVRLHQACDAHTTPMVRTRCETLAEIAATAVDLNSRRQNYGVPVVETFTQAATQAATAQPTRPWLLRGIALGTAAMAALVLGMRRLHRRMRRTAAPGVPMLRGRAVAVPGILPRLPHPGSGTSFAAGLTEPVPLSRLRLLPGTAHRPADTLAGPG